MPVINLPQDTRWGDAGQGLGKLLGGIAGAVGEAQMRKGMAEIQQDPNNSPNDITKKVFENWGKAGITALGEQFKVEGEQAQIRDTLAQAKGREMANERMKKLLDSMEGGGGGGASAGSFVDNIIASSGVAATPQLRAAATTAYTTAILTNKDPSAAVEHVLGTAQRGVGVRQSQEEHPLKMQELAGGAAAAPYKAPQAAATVQSAGDGAGGEAEGRSGAIAGSDAAASR